LNNQLVPESDQIKPIRDFEFLKLPRGAYPCRIFLYLIMPIQSINVAMIYDTRRVALRRNVKGQDLLGHINSPDFFMINPGTIINMNHLSLVDYKTRDCLMIPPFDKLKYQIACNKLAKFKERYDQIG